jgi:hypothetical protein
MASESEPQAKAKRFPADQPGPEEARLLMRDPLDFAAFRRGQLVKAYSPGQGWRSAEVVQVHPDHLLLDLSQRGYVLCFDSRNVLTAGEHKGHENHRTRLKALHERRAKQRRQRMDELDTQRLLLEATAAAPSAQHPLDHPLDN